MNKDMTITNIILNRGVDIQGVKFENDQMLGVNIANGTSVAKAVNVFHQYADGEIVVEYKVHPDFYDEDVKMYERRIKSLVSKCNNLEVVQQSENKVVDGFVFEHSFIAVLNYNREK